MINYIILIICILCLVILIVSMIIIIKNKNSLNKSNDINSINQNNNMNNVISEIGKINGKIESISENIKKDNEIVIATKFREITESNSKFSEKLTQDINTLKDGLDHKIDNKFINLTQLLKDNIDDINSKLKTNLGDGFAANSESLKEVTTALIKITESQKNLDNLNKEVSDLNNILNNTQARGKYGEAILGDILYQVFGDTHDLYQEQYAFKNGKIADAIVRMPSPINIVAIDSKFSFLDYEKLFDDVNQTSDEEVKKNFKTRLKEQISKISKDYIIKNVTCEYAIMFIPNDGIYQYIQKDNDLYQNVVLYAQKNKVILTSPSTLQAVLLNLNVLRINITTRKNISEILKQLEQFRKESEKFIAAWTKYSDEVTTVLNKKSEFEKSLDAINKRATRINNRYGENTLLENNEENLEK